jgi:hypothetical protein
MVAIFSRGGKLAAGLAELGEPTNVGRGREAVDS